MYCLLHILATGLAETEACWLVLLHIRGLVWAGGWVCWALGMHMHAGAGAVVGMVLVGHQLGIHLA